MNTDKNAEKTQKETICENRRNLWMKKKELDIDPQISQMNIRYSSETGSGLATKSTKESVSLRGVMSQSMTNN